MSECRIGNTRLPDLELPMRALFTGYILVEALNQWDGLLLTLHTGVNAPEW